MTNQITPARTVLSPAETDKAIQSQALSLGVTLRVNYDGRYPSGPNGEKLPSYVVAKDCFIDDRNGNRDKALDIVRATMTPAPIRTIEGWLAELSVIVARRADDEFADELRVTAYSSRLSSYPADVVRHVLFVRTWKFWPTWQELQEACEILVGPRKAMIAALERASAPPEPERERVTPERAAEILAELNFRGIGSGFA